MNLHTQHGGAVDGIRQRQLRKAQIVRDAGETPQGRALIELLADEFGYPPIGGENQFRAMANLGQSEVIRWLRRMELYRGIEDD